MSESTVRSALPLVTILLVAATWACADQPAPALPGGGAADTAASDAVRTAPAAKAVALALDGEGLRLVETASGSTRPLAFGEEAALVTATLERVLGAPPTETGRVEDCAQEYATWSPGFSVWFLDGTFVGWGLRDDGQPLTTMAGIGIGSSRAELESAYVIDVYESSLGVEFNAGALAGLMDGEGAGSLISHLWAGNTCIAR